MSDDTQHRLPSVFKGAAFGRTGVRGGPRLYNQLAAGLHELVCISSCIIRLGFLPPPYSRVWKP
jgi:hypothetical protein